MARDLHDVPVSTKESRAECGGVTMEYVKPLRYKPPQGPTKQMRNKPGLGGETMSKGTQGKR